MSKHNEVVATLNARLSQAEITKTETEEKGEEYSIRKDIGSKPDDKKILIQALLHMVDLSNLAMPWEFCFRWAGRCCREFTNQTYKEEKMGMPITGFMRIEDGITLCKSQIGFNGFVVSPLFKLIGQLLPDSNHLAESLVNNHKRWSQRLEYLSKRKENGQDTENVP